MVVAGRLCVMKLRPKENNAASGCGGTARAIFSRRGSCIDPARSKFTGQFLQLGFVSTLVPAGDSQYPFPSATSIGLSKPVLDGSPRAGERRQTLFWVNPRKEQQDFFPGF